MKSHPLKSFFSSALPASGDDNEISKDHVFDLITEIIKKENIAKPLSDEKISQELTKLNVSISRRTVAKYRDELNIPVMSKRRRLV